MSVGMGLDRGWDGTQRGLVGRKWRGTSILALPIVMFILHVPHAGHQRRIYVDCCSKIVPVTT